METKVRMLTMMTTLMINENEEFNDFVARLKQMYRNFSSVICSANDLQVQLRYFGKF